MADKKSLSALGDKSATDLAKLAGQVGSQGPAKHIAETSAQNDAFLNIGKDPSFLSATDLVKGISQVGIASDFAQHLPVPPRKADLQLPGMSQSVRVSLPRPIEDSHQQQNRETGGEKSIMSPANRGSEVEELEVVSPSDLGLLVRRARETRHLSQQSFADLAGVGRRFLSELENGKPTLELGKVLKVARTAGILLLARQR